MMTQIQGINAPYVETKIVTKFQYIATFVVVKALQMK